MSTMADKQAFKDAWKAWCAECRRTGKVDYSRSPHGVDYGLIGEECSTLASEADMEWAEERRKLQQ